jgi:hypothetical protein
VAAVMTGRAAHRELVDNGVSGLLEVGIVVVAQQVGTAAIDTASVAFTHDAFLPSRGMSLLARRVDRPTLAIVDQCSHERVGHELLDDAAGDGSAVIERAAIAANVQHNLGENLGATVGDQAHKGVGALLTEGWPSADAP